MSTLGRVPGFGIAMGMVHTLVRFFQPKVTVQYPEVVQEISPHHRGRLLLLYDEAGNLKCETCFQCAAACPIEIIDMGGVDTKNRYHVHWGPPEQYAERREESALRRSGRPVPDRVFNAWLPIDLGPLERVLVANDYDPRRLLTILEATQAEYGHLPVAAIQHISHSTGAWYSEIYGIATSYPNLDFEPGRVSEIGLCPCANCTVNGGGRVRDALVDALGTDVGGVTMDGAVRFVAAACGGDNGGEALVTLDGQKQPGMTADKAAELARTLRAQQTRAGQAEQGRELMNILPGPKGMPTILLARAGKYDPDGTLAAAEKAGAWATWKKAAPTMSPAAVTRLIADAGLRGRGGAGFPTADKWRAAAATDADTRYVVANGFEADPGAQVDRLLMERDPHAILEGLALAAYAVGASRGYVAVRANQTIALRRFNAALRAAEEAGYLGTDALGAGFDIHVEIVGLPGGLVVGEETTLMRAIENKRAQPDQRPPYPSLKGLWGRPTVVNNVETLALVPWIVANGSAAFADVGDDVYPGTTLIQITGAVDRPGVAEVPLGMSIRRLLEISGGARSGKSANLKAVLVGGPAGGFLPPSELDTLYRPDALAEKGAILGSGSIVVVDESTCIVDMATLLLRYLSDESCGKTIPCRIGVRRLYELGQRATTGLSKPTDAALAETLAADVRDGALCGLERLAPNPFTTGLRYFATEFEEHFSGGKCAAGVCNPVQIVAQPVSA